MPADQAATEHTQPAAAQASPQGLAGGTGHAGAAQAQVTQGWRRQGRPVAQVGVGRRPRRRRRRMRRGGPAAAACCQGFGDLEKLGLESEVADIICHVVGLGWRNNLRASLIGSIPYLLKTG